MDIDIGIRNTIVGAFNTLANISDVSAKNTADMSAVLKSEKFKYASMTNIAYVKNPPTETIHI
jgi:hypothetical protein